MESMNLHSGGELVTLDQLRMVQTPDATATHHPIPHFDFVDMVKFALRYHEHEVVEEHHAIDKNGDRYFGVLSLKSEYGDYCDQVGLRNSHDRSFPIGLSFGSRVFVCSNLAFCADTVVKRKHTLRARRELPAIIGDIVQPLQQKRLAQANQFEAYRNRPLQLDEFDHLVIELYRKGAINLQRIPDVMAAFERPPFDWGDPTAWRAFNAVTYALRGKVAEAPHLTQTLHQVIDAQFEVVS